MKSTVKVSLLIGSSVIAGAAGYAATVTSWHSLIDAAADQAIARRVNDVQDQLKLPKILRVGANGG